MVRRRAKQSKIVTQWRNYKRCTKWPWKLSISTRNPDGCTNIFKLDDSDMKIQKYSPSWLDIAVDDKLRFLWTHIFNNDAQLSYVFRSNLTDNLAFMFIPYSVLLGPSAKYAIKYKMIHHVQIHYCSPWRNKKLAHLSGKRAIV